MCVYRASTDDEQMGIIRADCVIPDGLKLFYFEIRIEEAGDAGYVFVICFFVVVACLSRFLFSFLPVFRFF